MGFDTIRRLFHKRYYSEGNSLESFLHKIHEKRVHFYVAGRFNPKTDNFDSFHEKEGP